MATKKSTDSFEQNIEAIEEIIEKLENGELGLDKSIEEYEKAMKLIKTNSELLNKAQGKILKVTKGDDDSFENLEIEEI